MRVTFIYTNTFHHLNGRLEIIVLDVVGDVVAGASGSLPSHCHVHIGHAAVLRTATPSTIKIGHYLLLIESITYVEVFPETIIIIIIVSSSPVCFIAHCVVSFETECFIVVPMNTSSEPSYTLNARKWICAKIECVLRVSTRLSSGMNEEEEKRKKKRKKAISNRTIRY